MRCGHRVLAMARALGMSAGLLAAWVVPAGARVSGPTFLAGAASADITPRAWTPASDGAFIPACGPSVTAIQQLWPGPRHYEFEEPYVDQYGTGRYAPGDPYCDANGNHRYEAPYIAGGSGQNHWPTSTDSPNPIRSEAVVFALGDKRIALVVVDSIGLFNTGMDLIRQAAKPLAPDVSQIFVSSTHDESAPDPIGLWGPDDSDLPSHGQAPAAVSSGVDDYYMSFLAQRTAEAIAQAEQSLAPAVLKLAQAHQPGNVQSCWSSYPYIDDQQLPVVQALNPRSGQVVFTLVNAQTHAETYAFSGDPTLTTRFSSDWPGPMRDTLEAAYPGSVGIELAGLVGSVETPTVYEPESTQVLNVPGPKHEAPGNPNGCATVYPEPATGTPVADPVQYLSAYGESIAHGAIAALAARGQTITPATLEGTDKAICLPVENNFFKAGFAAGLFPDRPAYADPTCLTTASTAGSGGAADPLYIKSDVGVLTVGPAQFVYSPGEVFPFTEIRGPMDEQQEPFPTDCYRPGSGSTPDDFFCGTPLPMTPWISTMMTAPYHFMAGLGEDMIGYLFPPGNFVGDQGETDQSPWADYQLATNRGATDRFGFHHSDDSESLGPHAGLAVAQAIASLLGGAPQPPHQVMPGLFVDASGKLSDSPFADPSTGFGGAVGVEVSQQGVPQKYLIGHGARGFATFDSRPDPGTTSTRLRYSVSSAGVIQTDGNVLLIDVFAGAQALLPPPTS
ncbi:MAG: hypothetical protein E6I48_07770 [Chloroflexi bacterium]|nr:MAG: hypothetical protein E6I48_07770 [Chloroflexota bacterium]